MKGFVMAFNRRYRCFSVWVVFLLLPLTYSLGFSQKHSLGQNLRFVKFQSTALTGNLVNDPATREVMVLLPPTYYKNLAKRFPVVYVLHGVGKRKDGHLEFQSLFVEMFGHMREKRLDEMILVAVDGTTIFGGSYYANSPTIGNFERYVVHEVVSLVDSLFRTKPERKYRAMGGFSMGGHGAIKLGMKYPAAFDQIGSLSGSPMSIRYRKSIYRNALKNHKKPKSPQELIDEIPYEKNWTLAAAYAKASAFSPNPSKSPLFLDLPFASSEGDDDDPVWQLWYNDDPLALVSRYQKNLRTMERIYIDHGHEESTLGTEDFIRELVRYGIGPTYYIYRGEHVDKLAYRYLRMFRTFSIHWID